LANSKRISSCIDNFRNYYPRLAAKLCGVGGIRLTSVRPAKAVSISWGLSGMTEVVRCNKNLRIQEFFRSLFRRCQGRINT
jgi:hypothetical protein